MHLVWTNLCSMYLIQTLFPKTFHIFSLIFHIIYPPVFITPFFFLLRLLTSLTGSHSVFHTLLGYLQLPCVLTSCTVFFRSPVFPEDFHFCLIYYAHLAQSAPYERIIWLSSSVISVSGHLITTTFCTWN